MSLKTRVSPPLPLPPGFPHYLFLFSPTPGQVATHIWPSLEFSDGRAHRASGGHIRHARRYACMRTDGAGSFLEATDKQRHQEEIIARLERQLREATRTAEEKAREAEEAQALNQELTVAQTELLETKRVEQNAP